MQRDFHKWKHLDSLYTYCGDAIIAAQNISEYSRSTIAVFDIVKDCKVVCYKQGKLLKKS